MSIAGFAANLVIANLLGPEVHGTYFLLVSVLYWLVIFGNLGLKKSLVKRLSEEGSSEGLIAAGLLAQFAIYVGLATVLLVASPLVNEYVGAPVTIWLLPMLFFKLVSEIVVGILDGQHKVHVSSLMTPVQWSFQSIIHIGVAVSGIGLGGLFGGYVVGIGMASLFGLYFANVHLEMPDWEDVLSLTSFAKYSWLSSAKSQAFASMDTIVLGAFVATNSLIGIYEIAWNLASLFAIFGMSISRAVFPEISSVAEDHTEVRRLVSDSLAYVGLFLIPGLVGAVLIGDAVLQLYGQAYTQGQLILVILVVARLVYAYNRQFLVTLDALDLPEVSFRVNLAILLTNLVANVVLIWAFGWIGAAVATTCSAVVGLVLSYASLRRTLDFSFPVAEVGRQVTAALVMAGVVLAGRMAVGDSIVATIALVAIGGGVYFGVLTGISSQFRKTVRDNLPVAAGRL